MCPTLKLSNIDYSIPKSELISQLCSIIINRPCSNYGLFAQFMENISSITVIRNCYAYLTNDSFVRVSVLINHN
ncbi:hypothetical protein BLOT_016762 [Blomia tropicalis]|nr:hypothetical protein BLOT_016762 [Blomia tropicalis]